MGDIILLINFVSISSPTIPAINFLSQFETVINPSPEFNKLSFENTEHAFAYKTNKQLKLAHFLFKSMGSKILLTAGLKIMPFAIKWNVPFAKLGIKNTIFKQFVGGETLKDTAPVVEKLAKHNVEVILDYGVEGGHGGDEDYDLAMNEFIGVIEYAATQPHIPFISIKVTGLVSSALLEKIDTMMQVNQGTLVKRYLDATGALPPLESAAWKRAVSRLMKICDAAVSSKTGVLVDAEETWIQDPVDAITLIMMDTYNKSTPIVYNTIQLYRHDRYEFLRQCYTAARERNFMLCVKLVRGAYMEKERRRAEEKGYTSPIQATKEHTDKDYDNAVIFCLEDTENIATIVATHNEKSNMLAAELLKDKDTSKKIHVHFSQLYGMSDNITFNLASQGYSVSKYLPFGPIKDVIPYLMRRAQENSSVGGQTSRELMLIEKEMKRRKM